MTLYIGNRLKDLTDAWDIIVAPQEILDSYTSPYDGFVELDDKYYVTIHAESIENALKYAEMMQTDYISRKNLEE